MDDIDLYRSPDRMSAENSAVVVVDMQQRLLDVVPGAARLVWNVRRLLDGAQILGVHRAGTEQYPDGLGPTATELAERLGHLPSKLDFSCGGCPEFFADLEARAVTRLLVTGIETHVCVLQTVLDALASGFGVQVCADAVGARHARDHEIALRRMESVGAVVTTTETALFEWCGTAGRDEFQAIRRLVQEEPPS